LEETTETSGLDPLAVEQSEEWVTGRRYLDMSELAERHHAEPGAKEVRIIMERCEMNLPWRKLQKIRALTVRSLHCFLPYYIKCSTDYGFSIYSVMFIEAFELS